MCEVLPDSTVGYPTSKSHFDFQKKWDSPLKYGGQVQQIRVKATPYPFKLHIQILCFWYSFMKGYSMQKHWKIRLNCYLTIFLGSSSSSWNSSSSSSLSEVSSPFSSSLVSTSQGFLSKFLGFFGGLPCSVMYLFKLIQLIIHV